MSRQPDAQTPIRVGVNGAGGRMGQAVCEAVLAASELELVAAVDPAAAGGSVGGIEIAGELRAFADASAEVVVDFTDLAAARVTLPWLALHGIHAVVGTSGFTDDDLTSLAEAFGGPAHCLIAPNFAISAVLMMRFAEVAAPYFDAVEIVEYHHDHKIDAPSGTAAATAERIAASRAAAGLDPIIDPTTQERHRGSRGAVADGGVHIHAVRMRGMVAHQEVILGATGQTLTLRQDSYDRSGFMPGVVLACSAIFDHPGLTVGLESYLGI